MDVISSYLMVKKEKKKTVPHSANFNVTSVAHMVLAS